MFIAKKHCSPDKRLILAVCDSDIKGEIFEENGLQLDLTSSFFDGKETEEKDVIAFIKEAAILTLVGKNITNLAIRLGLVNKQEIRKIKNIPHIHVF